jgi:protein-L-isoaspartate(D-aspartate) O-methyltransferase
MLMRTFIFLLAGFSASCFSQANYEEAGAAMVATQIKARGIDDTRVLAAMGKVPRHEFVLEALRDRAYEDSPLPIEAGQTISQPYIVAFMTQVLDANPDDKVLEIGTGSGYQAAILAELVAEIYTIEIIPQLAVSASEVLRRLGYKNVNVRAGDGYLGWEEAAPFDAIMVTARADHLPQPLIDQLKTGGRLIMPVGGAAEQSLQVLTKDQDGEIRVQDILPVRFVPLTREKES